MLHFMKKIRGIYFFVFIILFSCNKKIDQEPYKKSEDDLELVTIEYKSEDPVYLKNPEKSDTMCINAIERAKIDLKNYEGIFTQATCFGCKSEPYISETKKIVKSKGFKFHIEDFGCVIFEGQTEGCYSGYVNMIMKDRFGQGYYQDILDEAKENFIFNLVKNDSIISNYALREDERPKLKSQKIELIDEGIMPTIQTEFPLKIKSNTSLFLDLRFVIGKNGNVSNFMVDNWVNVYPENEKYRQELIDKAIEELKIKYSNWIPGRYSDNIVRTENLLRVHFE